MWRFAPICRVAGLCALLGAAGVGSAQDIPATQHDADDRAQEVHARYPDPLSPFAAAGTEEPGSETLAEAIADAYRTNPGLAAQRYDLRAIDAGVGLALSELRPTTQLQVSSGYSVMWPGDITQATRPIADQLNDPTIDRNDLSGQFLIDQPLSTGGRASAEIDAARADVRAGREGLRASEGDLILNVIAAYTDVRRDSSILSLRQSHERSLVATLDEVLARREAGELTRTDIAQAQVQLQAARAERNAAEAQLEESRATFAALVGREPGVLAEEPVLPSIPTSLDELMFVAEQSNPELGQAAESEAASRARIAVARAEGRPSLSVRGTVDTTGPVDPFDVNDQDLTVAGRLTLTIPLTAGGRVRALEDQALNRNSADRLRIEAARRELIQNLVSAWNRLSTAQRNETLQSEQLDTALIFFEGTREEYREGLRSTFDVLYAQNGVYDAQLALVSTRRDRYIAQALLLRRLGELDVGAVLGGITPYDPVAHAKEVERRSALPWDPLIRGVDRVAKPGTKPQRITPLPYAIDPVVASGRALPQPLPLISAGQLAPSDIGQPGKDRLAP